MKIGIGTANLNLKYGFKKRKIPKQELNLIKDYIKNKIELIDTAEGYKNYNLIKKIKNNNHKIITKLKIPNNCVNLETFVTKKIESILKKLNIKKLYGLLIHDVKDIENYQDYLLILRKVQKKKLIKKIGVSIYEPRDLKYLKLWVPDIVQFPYNIFDQRFSKQLLANLKKKKIELHSRSCFLQGILTEDLSNKNKRINYYIKQFNKWCFKNNLKKNEACINFVKNQKLIDYLILGFSNLKELKENIFIFKKKRS